MIKMKYAILFLIVGTVGAASLGETLELGNYDDDMKEVFWKVVTSVNSYSNQYLFKGLYEVRLADRLIRDDGIRYTVMVVLRDTACWEQYGSQDCQLLMKPKFPDVFCTARLTSPHLRGKKTVESCDCT